MKPTKRLTRKDLEQQNATLALTVMRINSQLEAAAHEILRRELTIGDQRREMHGEQNMRRDAQRGLVVNYTAAAQLVEELRREGLEKWAARMWDLGLYRKIGYDPDRDLGLSAVSPSRLNGNRT